MYKVVAYYTPDYSEVVNQLRASLELFNLDYKIQEIPDFGAWELNCGHKPFFLRQMIETTDKDIVYVDADAILRHEPVLFDAIEGDFAAHLYRGKEILSGTLFIKNNEAGRKILDAWCKKQLENPLAWDQKNLQAVLGDFVNLPASYCKIFDKMPDTVPVIEHFQFSRKVKRRKRMGADFPRKIGNVRIRDGADGSAYISRKDDAAIAFMDEHFDRLFGELRWVKRVPKGKTPEELAPLFKGKKVYLVGKGPSLDNLTDMAFDDPKAPVLAINEAIHKVESLDLPNPTFLIQFDVGLKDTCKPKKAGVIVSIRAQYFFEDKYVFDPKDYGLPGGTLTVLCAIAIAQKLEAKSFVFIAFDACVNKKTAYATVVGKPSNTGGRNPDRFLSHRAKIDKQLHGFKSEWVIPLAPTGKVSGKPQPWRDSLAKHHENAPASHSANYKDKSNQSLETEQSQHASPPGHSETP